MYALRHWSWLKSVVRRGPTHKLKNMKDITIKNLTLMKDNLSDAMINKKAYTVTDPSKLIDIIDSYIQIRQERDTYIGERDKLMKVLGTLQCMAESVQEIMEEN
jgi:hypothetical protein